MFCGGELCLVEWFGGAGLLLWWEWIWFVVVVFDLVVGRGRALGGYLDVVFNVVGLGSSWGESLRRWCERVLAGVPVGNAGRGRRGV